MFIVRKLVFLFLRLVSLLRPLSSDACSAETGHLGEPLGDSWWFQQVGSVQVHIRADPDLHWEIFVWDLVAKQRIGKPTFRPNLKDAYELGVRLQKHYADNPASSKRALPMEVVHG